MFLASALAGPWPLALVTLLAAVMKKWGRLAMTRSPRVPLSTLPARCQSGHSQRQRQDLRVLLRPPSKARCTGFEGLAGLLVGNAQGNAIGVDDRKRFSIFTALEIERLVMGTVDVDNLTWF